MDASETYAGQVRFIGIPSLAEVDEMQVFLDETRADQLEHIPDPKRVLWGRFGVWSQRTYVLMNDDGSFEITDYGSLDADVQDLIAR